MKYYLVRETCTATEKNRPFKNEVITYWYGKGDGCIRREAFISSEYDYDDTDWSLPYYGYKRECDAKRNYTYRNSSSSEYWKCEVDIVEVEA